jgi:two-component system LytT family response regulator
METLTAVILDDEQLARNMLQEYLQDVSWVKIEKSLGDPLHAINYLNKNTPDLLFLDIEMPELNGFEVLNRLRKEQLPNVIFSTAYDEYAIRAFEVNAIDYLLKPYTKQRLREALEKVSNNKSAEKLRHRIDTLRQQVQEQEYADQIYVRSRGSISPIQVEEILWIKADGDYSKIHLQDDAKLCGIGLGDLLKQLDPNKITRVHRSHALAVSAINKLEPNGYGGFMAYLSNGTELKISRHYAKQIKQVLI